MESLTDLTARVLNTTLTDFIKENGEILAECKEITSAGVISMLRSSADSSSEYLMLERAAYWRKQATAALSLLRYYAETNGYAGSLTVSQIFTSLTYGSAKLGEVCEATHLMLMYLNLADTQARVNGKGYDWVEPVH